jgi:predicted N-formylglutamate amidohydrolase
VPGSRAAFPSERVNPGRALVLSCEHGGNRIPAEYRPLFSNRLAQAALATHRGYDLGALAVARILARRFGVELVSSEWSRLLVDLNRSIGHARLFSEFGATLDREARRRVLERYYTPHRERVAEQVRARSQGGVLHVAMHSFTPELNGAVRTADIGILYHPEFPGERAVGEHWQQILQRQAPELRVRRNYPYLGRSDGLHAYLRRSFGSDTYWGIELEANQALLVGSPQVRAATTRAISDSLAELVAWLDTKVTRTPHSGGRGGSSARKKRAKLEQRTL